MLDSATTERIRSIFLHHEPSVSIPLAARLLGLSKDELEAAIDAGDVETTSTCSERVIDLRELAEQALHVWPIATIEEALGREAALILPPGCGRAGSRHSCRARLSPHSIGSRRRMGSRSKASSPASCTASHTSRKSTSHR